MLAIVDYLHSKGTDLATEGDRPYGNRPDGTSRAGYVWYHGRGFSSDDYRVISGGSNVNLAGHHVLGKPRRVQCLADCFDQGGFGNGAPPITTRCWPASRE